MTKQTAGAKTRREKSAERVSDQTSQVSQQTPIVELPGPSIRRPGLIDYETALERPVHELVPPPARPLQFQEPEVYYEEIVLPAKKPPTPISPLPLWMLSLLSALLFLLTAWGLSYLLRNTSIEHMPRGLLPSFDSAKKVPEEFLSELESAIHDMPKKSSASSSEEISNLKSRIEDETPGYQSGNKVLHKWQHLENAANEVKDLMSEADKEKAKLDTAADELKKKLDHRDSLLQELQRLNEGASGVIDKLKQLRNQKSQLEEQRASKNQELNDQMQSLQSVNPELDEIENTRKKKSDQVSRLLQGIKSIDRNVEKVSSEIQKHKAKMSEMDEKAALAQNNLQKNSDHLQRIHQDVQTKEEQVHILENELANLHQGLKAVDVYNSELQAMFLELKEPKPRTTKEAINGLQHQVSDLENEIKAWGSNHITDGKAANKLSRYALRLKKQELETRIEALSFLYDDLGIDSLEEDSLAIMSKVQDFRDSQSTLLNDRQLKLQKLLAEIEEQKNTLEKLQHRKSHYNDLVVNAKPRHDEMQHSLESMQSDLDSLRKKNSTMSEKLVAELEGLDEAKKQQDKVAKRYEREQTALEKTEEELVRIKERIKDVDNKITDVVSDQRSILENLVAAHKDYDSVCQQVEKARKSVDVSFETLKRLDKESNRLASNFDNKLTDTL